MSQQWITVRGARAHNLKNIDVAMPRDALVVITGLSGSGKSSLAFDTIYAEGQRRYVESLSAYARQFLEMQQKPDVDSIDGLSPAIAIEQKTTSRNPRSTVGTVTEIYDYMRLLWARIGVPHSPATGLPITSQTVSQMVDRLLEQPEGSRWNLLAPVIRGRKGEYRKELGEWRAKGYQRAVIDGSLHELDALPPLDKKKKHDISIVVDRIAIRPGITQRLADSLEAALRLADGLALAEPTGSGTTLLFSEKFACPVSGFTLPEIEPRLFSFNSPHGACATCDGLGELLVFDPALLIPNPDLSLAEGAIAPWAGAWLGYYLETLDTVAKQLKISLRSPWRELPQPARDFILAGGTLANGRPFEGVVPNLQRKWKNSESDWLREELGKYQISHRCPACEGKRLKPESLCVKVAGADISSITDLAITAAQQWFAALPAQLSRKDQAIAERILREINERLGFLSNVGLEYLTLARAAGTLSGGESQRIRLASQIGSGLTGVLYVLDEPSIGLHQRDNQRLLATLRRLRDLGNTVIVVEHDEDAIRAADWLIDMGPGAGTAGGQVVASGKPEAVFANPASLTAAYVTGQQRIPIPEQRRLPDAPLDAQAPQLIIRNPRGNNLRGMDVAIPLGMLVCVTGVSGGGKSTLIIETLYRAAARTLHGSREQPAPHDGITGLEQIDKIIDIDQTPIGRTPRSNPATYTGAFTPIRDWFAGLPEAKARGYGPGRFSFNVKGGRCEACQGDGVVKIEMHFLPDVFVPCEVCQGRRYNRETLEVTWQGKNIADVLDLSVSDGAVLFQAIPAIRDKLVTLERVGLGYMAIGQQATTLSGGEAQRIKLAKELARRATGRTLYILDEPTTGLHFADIRKLLEVLHALVATGNSVVVIEHNLDVIKTADWIIDLGPEGGSGGGQLVATGTPEAIARHPDSHTGRFLSPILGAGQQQPARRRRRA